MSPYQFYRKYLPLYLHFTSNYDVFKYRAKSANLTFQAFEQRRDQGIFASWATKYSQDEVGPLCLANFSLNTPHWLYQEKQDAADVVQQWRRIRQSHTEVSKNDLEVLQEQAKNSNGKVTSWHQVFKCTPSGKAPPIVQIAMAHMVSEEFFGSLSRAFGIDWRVHPAYSLGDPLVTQWLFIQAKYQPFALQFTPPMIHHLKEFKFQP